MSEDIPERCYRDKDILVVCFNKMYTNILAVFLKELFFTLFPNSWQLLSVAMAENCKLYGRVDKAKLKDELSQMQGDKGVIFIVEDSLLDLGMLDGIAMRFEQVMKIFINYVTTLMHIVNCSTKNPGIFTIFKICNGLNISITEFFSAEEFAEMEYKLE